jgi:hypothetical protein
MVLVVYILSPPIQMSTDLHFLKDIIELIPAVVSLIGLLGAGLEKRGGALYTKDPWIKFLHQLKQHSRIPTRDLVRIAMDLYGKMTPEMKDNLIKYHQVSPGIIQQLEDMYKRYKQSTLPPYKRDEELTKEVIIKALNDKLLLEYPLYLTWGSRDLRWVQRVLPDGRIEWKLEREPVKNILGEIPKPEPKRIEMESRPMLEEEKKSSLRVKEVSDKPEHPPPQPKPEVEPLPEYLEKLYEEYIELPEKDRMVLETIHFQGFDNAMNTIGIKHKSTINKYNRLYVKYKDLLDYAEFEK